MYLPLWSFRLELRSAWSPVSWKFAYRRGRLVLVDSVTKSIFVRENAGEPGALDWPGATTLQSSCQDMRFDPPHVPAGSHVDPVQDSWWTRQWCQRSACHVLDSLAMYSCQTNRVTCSALRPDRYRNPCKLHAFKMHQAVLDKTTDEWLRDGCLSVTQASTSWSCVHLSCYLRRGRPVQVPARSIAMSAGVNRCSDGAGIRFNQLRCFLRY